MGDNSKIQWTRFTWNPWHGCLKVSPGCKFCYMYRDKERYGQAADIVLKSKSAFNAPLKQKEPTLIFTCSWSDWFIDKADEWRPEAWEIIKNTPHHTYQILTKRPERIAACLPPDWGNGYPNVWLGISAENQEMFDKRIVELAKVNAAVKFVSAEPLIEMINVNTGYINQIDWVIIGGESGNDHGKYRYRSCELNWIEDITLQCLQHNVPVFVKQLGTYLSKQHHLSDRHGGEIDEWPSEFIKVRQMPM